MEGTSQRGIISPPAVDPPELEAGLSLKIRTSMIIQTDLLKPMKGFTDWLGRRHRYSARSNLHSRYLNCKLHTFKNFLTRHGKMNWRKWLLINIPKYYVLKNLNNNWGGIIQSSIPRILLYCIILLKNDIRTG